VNPGPVGTLENPAAVPPCWQRVGPSAGTIEARASGEELDAARRQRAEQWRAQRRQVAGTGKKGRGRADGVQCGEREHYQKSNDS